MAEGDAWEGDDPEPLLISALEHYSYCPRQCALIHIERTFDENIYTMRGHRAHERADAPTTRAERGVRVERALPIWSRRLGIAGRADVVEFRGTTPYPVEYKVGAYREWAHEAVQVCAQALCLEEMLGQEVPAGAIYYVASRTRREVIFDAALRAEVEALIGHARTLLEGTTLPPAPNDARCPKCSLVESCLPGVIVRPGRVRTYRARLFTLEESAVSTNA
jgi:CRISPR-associated exonuclease Cas4